MHCTDSFPALALCALRADTRCTVGGPCYFWPFIAAIPGTPWVGAHLDAHLDADCSVCAAYSLRVCVCVCVFTFAGNSKGLL